MTRPLPGPAACAIGVALALTVACNSIDPLYTLPPGDSAAPARWASVSVGIEHVCALTDTGAAYCWGINSDGELGNGSRSDTIALQPVAVAGQLRFTSISAGGDVTCAVAVDGAAYCWGNNQYGELADGTTNYSSVPVRVSGELTFINVQAGGGYACGIAAGGAAYCWGSNYYGTLGNGSKAQYLKAPVAVSGGHLFTAISVGNLHACALTVDGAAYCWGSGNAMELGSDASSNVPVAVPGGYRFRSVSANGSVSCGITATDAAYCWGFGGADQLGNGSTNNTKVPLPVSGSLAFASLSASFGFTCGLTTNGKVYCWGLGGHGMLGPVSSDLGAAPAAAIPDRTFEAVSSGSAYTCGVTDAGTAYCWGDRFAKPVPRGRPVAPHPITWLN